MTAPRKTQLSAVIYPWQREYIDNMMQEGQMRLGDATRRLLELGIAAHEQQKIRNLPNAA